MKFTEKMRKSLHVQVLLILTIINNVHVAWRNSNRRQLFIFQTDSTKSILAISKFFYRA